MDPIYWPLCVLGALVGVAGGGLWWIDRLEKRALAEARFHSAAAKRAYADAIRDVPDIIREEFAKAFRNREPPA